MSRDRKTLLNELIELEAKGDVYRAQDFIASLAPDENEAAVEALSTFCLEGSAEHLSFGAKLLAPLQRADRRIPLATLLRMSLRPDRPRDAELELNLAIALCHSVFEAGEYDPQLRTVDFQAGLVYLGAIFLRRDPDFFWQERARWPRDRFDEMLGEQFVALTSGRLAELRAQFEHERATFSDAEWQAIEARLAWGQKVLDAQARA